MAVTQILYPFIMTVVSLFESFWFEEPAFSVWKFLFDFSKLFARIRYKIISINNDQPITKSFLIFWNIKICDRDLRTGWSHGVRVTRISVHFGPPCSIQVQDCLQVRIRTVSEAARLDVLGWVRRTLTFALLEQISNFAFLVQFVHDRNIFGCDFIKSRILKWI